MLKIHKPFSKKLLLIPITSICITFGLLGFYYLTYTPELSHAESVTSKKTLADIEYMQDVTADICTNTPEADTAGNYQYQLKDSRDQKTYWVAKLKDGNCWMIQNLDYDGGGILAELSSWENDGSIAQYYNPGDYVYMTPTSHDVCTENDIGLSACTNNGWKFVGNMHASTDPDFYRKNSAVVNGDVFDAHYSVGNYYSYMAAVAETHADTGVAAGDICPSGWQLPSVGSSSISFYQMFDSYNVLHVDIGTGEQDIRVAPLYFIYNGYVIKNSLKDAGNWGWYWTSSAYAGNNKSSYALAITTSILTSVSPNRYLGAAIRCAVIGEEARMEHDISINIDLVIGLDVADEVNVEKSETNPSTANLDVKVSSNQKYSVGISATNPNLTSTTSEVKIPAKSGLLNTAENGWGIKLSNDTNYTALTTSLQTFYTASGAEIKTIPFTIGISTAPDLPNGEYSTNITITAVQN